MKLLILILLLFPLASCNLNDHDEFEDFEREEEMPVDDLNHPSPF